MLRVAERFSAVGLGVIPHLNAVTAPEWELVATLLRDQPQITKVCKEFQTGLLCKQLGFEAVEDLVRLQDKVNRPIYPILFGGRRFLPFLSKHFKQFTIIDGTPFMRTYFRQVLRTSEGSEVHWRPRRTRKGEPIGRRLSQAISDYTARLQRRAYGNEQSEFPFAMGKPTCPQENPAAWELFAYTVRQSPDIAVDAFCQELEPSERSPSASAAVPLFK
jgi:hypothetical protein